MKSKKFLLLTTGTFSLLIVGVISYLVLQKNNNENINLNQVSVEIVEGVEVEDELTEDNVLDGTDLVEVVEDETEVVGDKNLIPAITGSVYVITETQNLYKEPLDTSFVVTTYEVDTEIEVSGIYGTTGFAQVVKKGTNEVLGYINSDFISKEPTKVVSVEVDGVTEDNIDDFMSQGTPLTDAEYQALLELVESQGAPDMGGVYVSENDTGAVTGIMGEENPIDYNITDSKYDSVTTD